MLFNRTGTHYSQSFDWNRVRTRSSSWTVKCKLVPVAWDEEWIGGAINFDWYKLYTRDLTIEANDKIEVDGVTYLVHKALDHRGAIANLWVYLVKKSKGD